VGRSILPRVGWDGQLVNERERLQTGDGIILYDALGEVRFVGRLSYQVMGTWIYCWLYYIRG
jgi:hypothetical protein